MIRLFTAITLPDSVLDHLSLVKGGIKGARWIPRDNIHLTLNFLGEVDNSLYAEVVNTLQEIHFKKFMLKLQGVGYFKRGSNPTVLWLGVGLSEDLITLQESLQKKLEEIGLQFEKRNFHPHVTIARLKGVRMDVIPGFFQQYGGIDYPAFEIDSLSLYSSKSSSSGPQYHQCLSIRAE